MTGYMQSETVGRDEVVAALSMWDACGGGECPVQHFGAHDGVEYYVRYRHGGLTVDADDTEDVLDQDIGAQYDGWWTDEQTTVYLYLIAGAIRRGDLAKLVVPTLVEASAHPAHIKGPLPTRLAGIDRAGADVWVSPMDLDAWLSENPADHRRLRKSSKRVGWATYCRLQSPTS